MLRRWVRRVARWRACMLERDAAALYFAMAIAIMHRAPAEARRFRESAQVQIRRARWWRRFLLDDYRKPS